MQLSTGCYYASDTETQSWTGSRLACEDLSGYLAVITSGEEQTAINGYLATVYPGKYLTIIRRLVHPPKK